MKPTKIQFDTEFEDDGLYSISFWFDKSNVPSYLALSRDEIEDPDFAYIEAEDQKYGFRANDLFFKINGTTIELEFDRDSNSYFYWDNSKSLKIEIPEEEMPNAERYLVKICK